MGVSAMSQENREAQTVLKIRTQATGLSTAKPPRGCHILYRCDSKEQLWEGIWWRLLLSRSSEEDLGAVWVRNFLRVPSTAWLMRCIWPRGSCTSPSDDRSRAPAVTGQGGHAAAGQLANLGQGGGDPQAAPPASPFSFGAGSGALRSWSRRKAMAR